MSIFRRQVKSPEYTRRQWIMKAITLFLSATAMDMAGLKIYQLEVDYAYHRVTYEQAFGLPSAYYFMVFGLSFGLATWKLFEMYWWAKDNVEKVRNLEKLQQNSLKPDIFSGVTEFTNSFTSFDVAMSANRGEKLG